jgi:hypothetical protein
MLAASLPGGGPLADSIRIVAVVVVAALGALVVFLAVVFAVAILDQRSPRIRSDLDEHAASVRTVARGLTTLPAPGPCTRQFRGGRPSGPTATRPVPSRAHFGRS